jgi:S-DNA-T family DNA segregation ATPase FtsK/SpoIIIE
VVLDEMGADKLLGNGDMLFLLPGTSTLLRGQGTYLSDDEINRVLECVGTNQPQFVSELVQLKPAESGEGSGDKFKNRDELYEEAVDVVIREGRGSVSLLQRALGIGYGRAARLIDYMAEDGIVGQYNGSQAREVIITLEQWAAMLGQGEASSATTPLQGVPASTSALTVPAAKPKRNRILPDPDDEADDDYSEGDSADSDAPWDDEDDDAGGSDGESDDFDESEDDAGADYSRGRYTA